MSNTLLSPDHALTLSMRRLEVEGQFVVKLIISDAKQGVPEEDPEKLTISGE